MSEPESNFSALSPADVVRAFVALPVPDAVKAALSGAQAELRAWLSPRAATWTRPENQHVTLRFLGSVAVAGLPELSARLRAAVGGFGALELECARLGAFPDPQRARVVWAGVTDAEGRLESLHQRVSEAVAAFAQSPPENRFAAHVTLARLKSLPRPVLPRLAEWLERGASRRFGGWRATTVELIRSELSAEGSRYTTLDVFPLVG